MVLRDQLTQRHHPRGLRADVDPLQCGAPSWGDAAAHGFHNTVVSKRLDCSWVTTATVPCDCQDRVKIGYTNEVNDFPRVTEMFYCGKGQIFSVPVAYPQ